MRTVWVDDLSTSTNDPPGRVVSVQVGDTLLHGSASAMHALSKVILQEVMAAKTAILEHNIRRHEG